MQALTPSRTETFPGSPVIRLSFILNLWDRVWLAAIDVDDYRGWLRPRWPSERLAMGMRHVTDNHG
jgi:hypothetical protein